MDNVIGTGFVLSSFALVVSLITLAHSCDHDRDIERLQARMDTMDTRFLDLGKEVMRLNCKASLDLGDVKARGVYYVGLEKRIVFQYGPDKYEIVDGNMVTIRLGVVNTLAEVKEYMVKMEYRTSPMECDSSSF